MEDLEKLQRYIKRFAKTEAEAKDLVKSLYESDWSSVYPPQKAVVVSYQTQFGEPSGYRIYLLLDPRDQAICYVGITINPRERLWNHVHVVDKYNPQKTTWIQELARLGLVPIMKIVHSDLTKKRAMWMEMELINEYLNKGIHLYNIQTKRRKPF